MDEKTFNSLLSVIDWLTMGGYDEPKRDIKRVRAWALRRVIRKSK